MAAASLTSHTHTHTNVLVANLDALVRHSPPSPRPPFGKDEKEERKCENGVISKHFFPWACGLIFFFSSLRRVSKRRCDKPSGSLGEAGSRTNADWVIRENRCRNEALLCRMESYKEKKKNHGRIFKEGLMWKIREARQSSLIYAETVCIAKFMELTAAFPAKEKNKGTQISFCCASKAAEVQSVSRPPTPPSLSLTPPRNISPNHMLYFTNPHKMFSAPFGLLWLVIGICAQGPSVAPLSLFQQHKNKRF